MIRLAPRSLFGQTLLILLAGLVVSHLVGAWIYAGDRRQAVEAVAGLALAPRVANLARLISETPPASRARIIDGVSDPTFRVELTAAPPSFVGASTPDGAADAIASFLLRELPEGSVKQVRGAIEGHFGPPFAAMRGHVMPFGPMMRGGVWRGLQVALELPDGQWLSFATVLPDTGRAVSWQFMSAMAIMALIVLVASAWAVRRLSAPLRALASAAERLGKDVSAPGLPEIGTVEMQQASRAFNDMQRRIKRLVESRTQMLAAISHDLRTPLTLLRLRAENVESGDEREKMLATIAEMETMIAATLAFARDEAKAEPRRPTDLTALVASIVHDMADAGRPVTLDPAEPMVSLCQPAALKRALFNLIDNAIQYGKAAHVALATTVTEYVIIVDDEGPGIPEAELQRVFQPFYRLEGSRSRDTGGIGLGLAIALSIVQAHGGTIVLRNRPNGGLRAALTLPR
jgi:signal transduction histidine kinase